MIDFDRDDGSDRALFYRLLRLVDRCRIGGVPSAWWYRADRLLAGRSPHGALMDGDVAAVELAHVAARGGGDA